MLNVRNIPNAWQLDKEVFRLISIEKLEKRFESRSGYIWEEYELTYNNALPFRDASDDPLEMKDNINILKTKIRGLGVIHVGAIEEYRRSVNATRFFQRSTRIFES